MEADVPDEYLEKLSPFKRFVVKRLWTMLSMLAMLMAGGIVSCATGVLDGVLPSGETATAPAPATAPEVILVVEQYRDLEEKLAEFDPDRQIPYLSELIDTKNDQLDTLNEAAAASDETIATLTTERDTAVEERDAAVARLNQIEAALTALGIELPPPPEEETE